MNGKSLLRPVFLHYLPVEDFICFKKPIFIRKNLFKSEFLSVGKNKQLCKYFSDLIQSQNYQYDIYFKNLLNLSCNFIIILSIFLRVILCHMHVDYIIHKIMLSHQFSIPMKKEFQTIVKPI